MPPAGWAAQLNRWAALPELTMRRQALLQALLRVPAVDGAELLEALMRQVRSDQPTGVAVYLAILEFGPLQQALGPARLLALALAARATAPLAELWLRAVRDVPVVTPQDAALLVHAGLREVSLGERRALARRASGDLLNRLTWDPDATVIAHLMDNPHVTESHVLAVCARRPTLPAPLLQLLQHPRWSSRYRVRLALVQNPYLPWGRAVPLMLLLRDVDLRPLAQDASLSPAARQAAAQLLAA